MRRIFLKTKPQHEAFDASRVMVKWEPADIRNSTHKLWLPWWLDYYKNWQSWVGVLERWQ
jgi:hypothetical protein